MTLAFRHRPIPPSLLARWDARWKLASVIIAAGGIASLDHLLPASAALLLGACLLAAARLSPAWCVSRLSLFALATLPFLLVLPLTLDGEGWYVGPLFLSERGMAVGLAVFCRAVAIGCFALVLIGTAPFHHTLAAAHRLKIPGLLVQLTLLAHRYSLLLADEFRRLRIALRTRGFRMRVSRRDYRSLGYAAGALLVRGSERAENVAAAMRTRGFGGTYHSLAVFRNSFGDVIAFLALLAATIALVLWDRVVLS